MTRFMLPVLLFALVACAPRGRIIVDPTAAAVGAAVPVFVGTTRGIDPETNDFTGTRSEVMRFARYDVSIPPDRDPGEIRTPRRNGRADARRDFLMTGAALHPTPAAFRADLASALRVRPRDERNAVIFVHGFNTNFSEGVYRLAQLSYDLDVPGVPVHYSWPSKASPLDYVYDRDSASFARDGLENLISESARAGADSIILVAHSMGTALTMETLRQIAIRGDRRTLDRLGGVILISPDIDVDLFRQQARAIGALPQPFVIFGSNRDRILNISAFIAGRPERLGNLTDVGRLADLEVTYLDVRAYADGDGHFPLGRNPSLIRLMGSITDIDAALTRDERGRVGLLPGVVLSVQNATEIILAPVGVISDELSR